VYQYPFVEAKYLILGLLLIKESICPSSPAINFLFLSADFFMKLPDDCESGFRAS
jgi:hypothetical protein